MHYRLKRGVGLIIADVHTIFSTRTATMVRVHRVQHLLFDKSRIPKYASTLFLDLVTKIPNTESFTCHYYITFARNVRPTRTMYK